MEIDSWRRSSRCESNGCVEVKLADTEVLIRDSKDSKSPILSFPRASWQEFVAGIRAGDFDS